MVRTIRSKRNEKHAVGTLDGCHTKKTYTFIQHPKMISLIKPILFAFIKTTAVKELIVKLLEAYAKSTDNTVDDKLVVLVKKNLLPE